MTTSIAISSLGSSNQVADALDLQLVDRDRLKRTRADHDLKMGELKEGDERAAQSYELWLELASDSKKVLGAEKWSRLKVLGAVVAGDSGRLGRKVLRFEKPLIVALSLDLPPPELTKIRRTTSELLVKFRSKKGEIIGSCLSGVCDALPVEAEVRFQELIGDNLLDLRSSPTTWKYNSIATAKKKIVLEVVKNEALRRELEFTDSQTEMLDAMIETLSNDVDFIASSEAVQEFRRAELPVPDAFLEAADEQEKRIESVAETQILALLLPHQKTTLANAAIQLFLTHNKSLPVRWPCMLAEELNLNQQERETLEDATEIEIAVYRKKIESAMEKLVDELPPESRTLLDKYEAIEKSCPSIEDLLKTNDTSNFERASRQRYRTVPELISGGSFNPQFVELASAGRHANSA